MKYIYLILAVWLLAGCGGKETQPKTNKTEAPENIVTLTDAQMNSAGIKTGNLTEKNLSRTIKLNGKIDVPPQNLVSVSVPLGGYLKYTKLLPGMHLQKGEVIAVLEDQQYIQLQQEYLTTRAQLQMAENEHIRQKELNESKASSDKVYQQAKADYQSLKITLRALAEKLKLININPQKLTENTLSRNINLYAPFDGFVSAVNVNIGKYVSPSDVLFEIVNPQDIHLNLKVFEKDLTELSIGQKVLAFTNSDPNKKYHCEIILIGKDISSERSAEVHCHFEEYDKSLLPGMYMNAEIELKNKQAAAVPEKAIVNFGGKNYLFADKGNNTFEMLEVNTGEKENNWVEILNSEPFNNTKIVTDGAYALLMSLKNKAEEE